jgi:8-oxo-dGTP pyrophosphatase MutT (NUDIX family)
MTYEKAGVIVTNGKLLLMGHVTGQSHFDIPKGNAEPNEEIIDTAIRELKEETSLIISPSNLIPLGRDFHKKHNFLTLFLLKVEQMPDISSLKCTSMVKSNNPFPEFDYFAMVSFDDIPKYAGYKLTNRLIKEQTKILSYFH